MVAVTKVQRESSQQVSFDITDWLLSVIILKRVSPTSSIYSQSTIKSDVLCRLLTKFSFSESQALRSSASYSLSLDIISQTILFESLQVARVEHCTVLRRYFCLVVLEPNVERDNDFINRHGMKLERLLGETERERKEWRKKNTLHLSTSWRHIRQYTT